MNEQHENVTVNFPDKMEVDAPKTDNLIRSLTQAFKSLSNMLQTSFREIADALQTLKHLPDLVRSFQEEVTHQFTNLFAHQVEAQILARQANILSARKKREIVDLRQKEKMNHLSQMQQ